jgi:opine dehydrogenase
MSDGISIAVLGGGHAAFAHAADLSLKGMSVRLCEVPAMAHVIEPVRAAGGIESEPDATTGLPSGFGALELATTDPAAALNGAEIIFLVVPAFAQAAFAELIAPHVTPEQVVVLSPGNFGGAYTFAQALRAHGCATLPYLAEAQSMIYACRKGGPALIRIFGFKEGLRVAVYPAKHTERVVGKIQQVFPGVVAAPNILWTWLSNPNAIIHPPVTILNAGRLENTQGDFLFYVEGLTPAVQHIVDELDRERMALGRALGLELMSKPEMAMTWYGHQGYQGASFPDKARNPVYYAIKADSSLDGRYLTEDVPFGLVPWENLARLVGVEMPICTSLINLANGLLQTDFRATGQTLERIGLGDVGVEELLRIVEEGE